MRSAASVHARLVVIDMVAPDEDMPDPVKVVDVAMLAMVGGRRRSRSEWARLITDGGFRLERVVCGSGTHPAVF
ncbi:methyltransferase [Mycobacterium simiae]|uniref:methyltransferase n=1 Tax=Mycobacterium simiae TaxID=1784 RepID=UPI001592EE88|nr:methyltransferase [Mycobacterium simiae]